MDAVDPPSCAAWEDWSVRIILAHTKSQDLRTVL